MLCARNSELGEVGDILILRKAKVAYEFSRSKEKINHLLFMDDLNYIVAMRNDWT